jgi:trehalose 6-phosphate phosphatase
MPDRFDDPVELASQCADRPRPWLIGVDVDGTLAPIVSRPEAARLEAAALDTLMRLRESVGVMVAVLSGRPLADLRDLFGLPSTLMLHGSHGAEVGSQADLLSDDERARLAAIAAIAEEVSATLPGSWVEHKPLAVALHVRLAADPDAADAALHSMPERLAAIEGLTHHHGRKVHEVAIRPVTKAAALEQLRVRLEPATTIFVGDDQSDELVFEALAPSDVGIKVGTAPTAAPHRLESPTQVVAFLAALADHLAALASG